MPGPGRAFEKCPGRSGRPGRSGSRVAGRLFRPGSRVAGRGSATPRDPAKPEAGRPGPGRDSCNSRLDESSQVAAPGRLSCRSCRPASTAPHGAQQGDDVERLARSLARSLPTTDSPSPSFLPPPTFLACLLASSPLPAHPPTHPPPSVRPSICPPLSPPAPRAGAATAHHAVGRPGAC